MIIKSMLIVLAIFSSGHCYYLHEVEQQPSPKAAFVYFIEKDRLEEGGMLYVLVPNLIRTRYGKYEGCLRII